MQTIQNSFAEKIKTSMALIRHSPRNILNGKKRMRRIKHVGTAPLLRLLRLLPLLRCSYQINLEEEKGATGTGETLEQIGFPNVPIIENIHQRVFEAASGPKALNMGNWHTCDTIHCRAGWVEHLAGEEGKVLAAKTSTLFAAMQIYKKSSPEIRVWPPRFFEDNATALADMKKCAELEAEQEKSNA